MNLNNLNLNNINGLGTGSNVASNQTVAQGALLNPNFSTQVLYPFDEASGTVARNIGPSANGSGTYVGSPTLGSTLVDDYSNPTKTMVTLNGTSSFARIPTTNLGFMIDGSTDWSIHFVYKNNTTSGPGSVVTAFGGSNLAANTYMIMTLNQDPDLFNLNNSRALFYWRNNGGTLSLCQFLHEGLIFDGQYHHICVEYTQAAGGTLTIYIDGVAGTPTATGADANRPGTMPTAIGVGTFWQGSDAAAAYFNPGSFENFTIMKHALTSQELFNIGYVYNGDPQLGIEFSSIAREAIVNAQSQLVNVASIGDSNEQRNWESSTVGVIDQGYIYTASLMLQGALGGQKLAGYRVGVRSYSVDDKSYLGVTTNLIAGYSATDVNSTFIDDRSLAKWNDPAEGGNNPFSTGPNPAGPGTGFKSDARWKTIDAALTYANSQTTINAASDAWMLASNANIRIVLETATFNQAEAAPRGNFYPNFKIGGTTIGGTVVNSLTGVNGWTTQTLNVGTALNGTSGILSLAISGGSNATGPVGANNTYILDINKTTGFIYGTFWAWGGMSALETAESVTDAQTTIAKLAAYFQAVSKPIVDAGQTPKFIIKCTHGGNDVNRLTETSYVYSAIYLGGDGSVTNSGTALSYTRAGYQNNIQTIADRLLDGWLAAGYSRSNFYVFFSLNHEGAPTPGSWMKQQDYARAERTLCSNRYPNKSFRLNGPVLVPYTTMSAALGYASLVPNANDDSDLAHLSKAGYALLGTTAGTALNALL